MIVKKMLLLFAGAIFISNLSGQESLSLNQAIELGLRNNYDITISEKNVDVARNLNTEGEAGRWPSLQFGLNQDNSARDQVQNTNPYGSQGITIVSSVTPSLSLNWALFEGFKVNITRTRYDNLQLESEGNASIIVSNSIQAIVLGYYLVSLEKEKLDVFRTTLKLSRDRYNYVGLKKDYGSAVTTDLLLEESNYLTDSVNFINQQLAYRSAVRTLNSLMAVKDLNKEYFYLDIIEVPLEKYRIKDLEAKMLENNVDLKTKYLSQSVLKEEMNLARSERYPKINMRASAGESWGRVDQSLAKFLNPQSGGFETLPVDQQVLNSVSINYTLGFSLTYNLFNGRKINTALKNALVREDIGNIEIDKITLSLRNDLYTEYDKYSIRQQLYGINKRKLESAELNQSITENKFKLGAINSFDFRTVQINYLTAALQELNSRYGLVESKVALMRLTGTILEVYQ